MYQVSIKLKNKSTVQGVFDTYTKDDQFFLAYEVEEGEIMSELQVALDTISHMTIQRVFLQEEEEQPAVEKEPCIGFDLSPEPEFNDDDEDCEQ